MVWEFSFPHYYAGYDVNEIRYRPWPLGNGFKKEKEGKRIILRSQMRLIFINVNLDNSVEIL